MSAALKRQMKGGRGRETHTHIETERERERERETARPYIVRGVFFSGRPAFLTEAGLAAAFFAPPRNPRIIVRGVSLAAAGPSRFRFLRGMHE